MLRRDLLKTLAMTGAWMVASKKSKSITKMDTTPVVLSTWYNQKAANVDAWEILRAGGTALDAVEKGVQVSENDPFNCCVGLNGNPDRTGIVTLDACIMDHLNNIGGVAAVEQIKNPIRLARMVMEKTDHVLLVGEGAKLFALEQGFSLESTELSDHALKAYNKWKKNNEIDYRNIEKGKLGADKNNHDTIGMIALDSFGNLSGACTTSGMGFKRRGRVGDSPIIGAGLFVDNEIGAATASGHGEEIIRIAGSHLVVEFMRQGFSPEKACMKAVERIRDKTPRKLDKLQIGFIAINKQGEFGSYSLQKGFDYAVINRQEFNQKHEARYLIK